LVIIVPTSFSASAYMEFPPRGLSLQWYRNYFASRAWIEPTLLSVRVAVVTMILSTVVGTLAAFGLVRGRFRGRRLLEFFLLSPAAFAFLTSFDEVVLSVFLGGPAATTLPKRMWDNVRHEIDPTITAVASILIAGSIVVLTLAELLRRAAAPISAGPDGEPAA